MLALHLSPHPDDELLGAPATLMALRDAGWTVVDAACSLGRPEDRPRRARELAEAARRARFELVLPARPVAMSIRDGPDRAERELAEWFAALLEEHAPALVLSPSPHDGHPGHEVVGRAARTVLGRRGLRWWMWGLWADLPLPTLLVPFGPERLAEIERALEAHAGELARNDYRALLRGRALANRVLGPERVFGFGVPGEDGPFAELLTEVAWCDGTWRLGAAARLGADGPPPYEPGADVGWWVSAESVAQRLAARPR